ncbi:MAG: C2HC-type zinc finger protein, partial [Bacteroidota bacterium]
MADRRAGPNDGLRVLKKQEDYEQWVYEIKLFLDEKDASAASIPDLMEELEDEEDDRTMLSPLERVKDVRKCCAIPKEIYEVWSGELHARERKSRTMMLRKISRSIGRDYTHLVRDGVADPCLVLARIMNFFEDTEEEDAEELHEDFLGLRIGQFESATKFCSEVKLMAKKLNALGKTITPTALKLALVRGLKEEPQFEKFYDYVRHAHKQKTIEKLVRDIVKEARLKGSDSIDMAKGEPERKKKGGGKPSGKSWVSKVKCWRCGELGHLKRNCPKGQNERTKERGAENINEAASDSEDSFVWSMADAKIENPVWLLAIMNGVFAVLLATTF